MKIGNKSNLVISMCKYISYFIFESNRLKRVLFYHLCFQHMTSECLPIGDRDAKTCATLNNHRKVCYLVYLSNNDRSKSSIRFWSFFFSSWISLFSSTFCFLGRNSDGMCTLLGRRVAPTRWLKSTPNVVCLPNWLK